MSANEKRSQKTLRLVMLALLTALLLLFEVTGLGYIRTPGLEFTVMQVPVIIGAIVLGPGAGAVLGTVFGLTSFWQCLSGKSLFGATLLNISPIGTFLTTVPTRALMGYLCGLIFWFLWKKMRQGALAHLLASLAGAMLNTVLFMGALVLFFYQTSYIQGFVSGLGAGNAFVFVLLFVGLQGLLEALISAFICTVISRALTSYVLKR